MGLCAAILIAVQIAKATLLPMLPNVELVSPLIIVYTLAFRRRVFYIVYTFVLVEGVYWGFAAWWFSFLYVWAILAGAALLLRGMKNPLGWAILAGAFGLLFGTLCAATDLLIGGFGFAAANWVRGIPFDLIHCAGNFVLCLLLWKPLNTLFSGLLRRAAPRNDSRGGYQPPAGD